MDKKQFDLFQTAIQWVADEDRRPPGPAEGLLHLQRYWGRGIVDRTELLDIEIEPNRIETYYPVCATACCVAGNIVQINGDKFVIPYTCARSEYNAMPVEECVDEDGTLHRIGRRATELSGLTDTEADRLFNETNTAEEIIHIAYGIAKRHHYDLTII